jgi:hypothetical protein
MPTTRRSNPAKPKSKQPKKDGGPGMHPEDLPNPTKGFSRPGNQRWQAARATQRQEKGSRKPGRELPRGQNR